MENIENDEITLKELILKIKEYWTELWNNKRTIILFCIPFVAFFLYKAYTTPTEYKANLNFIVEGQGGGGGISSLLGQFGFRSGGSGKTNPFQIIEITKSKMTLKEIIFTKENEEYLANTIIEDYDLEKAWKKNIPEMEGFQFNHDSLKLFNENELIALTGVIGKILGPEKNPELALLQVSFNEDTGIFSLNAKTLSEDVSFALVENTYDVLKNFYEKKALENQIQTRNLLKKKVDSLDATIKLKFYQVARFEDQNRNLISLERSAQKNVLMGEIQALSTALGEAMKSFEIADYSLKDSQPLFMLVDKSFKPASPVRQSKLVNIIKGLLFGGFLAGGFIIGRKIYRDAMEE
jgi:phosphoribosylformylglycinamidine (FGAM) synthase PurS component